MQGKYAMSQRESHAVHARDKGPWKPFNSKTDVEVHETENAMTRLAKEPGDGRNRDGEVLELLRIFQEGLLG